MNLLCRLFGHRTPEGPHLVDHIIQIRRTGAQNLGVESAEVRPICPRCNQRYLAGYTWLIPLTDDQKLESLRLRCDLITFRIHRVEAKEGVNETHTY